MNISKYLNKLADKRYQMKIVDMYRRAGVYPASDGRSMDVYCNIIKFNTTLKVRNVFELGANYGQDAERIRHNFQLEPNVVYVFEAHPQIAAKVSEFYNFHVYNLAVYNEVKKVAINIVDINDETNTGVSTMQKSLIFSFAESVEVDAVRMDEFMKEKGISEIDFCKIDVEGVNWEALDGFGDKLYSVNAIQIEAEHRKCYDEEHLWPDIVEILEAHGFRLMHFERHMNQSDSFWVQERFIKREI